MSGISIITDEKKGKRQGDGAQGEGTLEAIPAADWSAKPGSEGVVDAVRGGYAPADEAAKEYAELTPLPGSSDADASGRVAAITGHEEVRVTQAALPASAVIHNIIKEGAAASPDGSVRVSDVVAKASESGITEESVNSVLASMGNLLVVGDIIVPQAGNHAQAADKVEYSLPEPIVEKARSIFSAKLGKDGAADEADSFVDILIEKITTRVAAAERSSRTVVINTLISDEVIGALAGVYDAAKAELSDATNAAVLTEKIFGVVLQSADFGAGADAGKISQGLTAMGGRVADYAQGIKKVMIDADSMLKEPLTKPVGEALVLAVAMRRQKPIYKPSAKSTADELSNLDNGFKYLDAAAKLQAAVARLLDGIGTSVKETDGDKVRELFVSLKTKLVEKSDTPADLLEAVDYCDAAGSLFGVLSAAQKDVELLQAHGSLAGARSAISAGMDARAWTALRIGATAKTLREVAGVLESQRSEISSMVVPALLQIDENHANAAAVVRQIGADQHLQAVGQLLGKLLEDNFGRIAAPRSIPKKEELDQAMHYIKGVGVLAEKVRTFSNNSSELFFRGHDQFRYIGEELVRTVSERLMKELVKEQTVDSFVQLAGYVTIMGSKVVMGGSVARSGAENVFSELYEKAGDQTARNVAQAFYRFMSYIAVNKDRAAGEKALQMGRRLSERLIEYAEVKPASSAAEHLRIAVDVMWILEKAKADAEPKEALSQIARNMLLRVDLPGGNAIEEMKARMTEILSPMDRERKNAIVRYLEVKQQAAEDPMTITFVLRDISALYYNPKEQLKWQLNGKKAEGEARKEEKPAKKAEKTPAQLQAIAIGELKNRIETAGFMERRALRRELDDAYGRLDALKRQEDKAAVHGKPQPKKSKSA